MSCSVDAWRQPRSSLAEKVPHAGGSANADVRIGQDLEIGTRLEKYLEALGEVIETDQGREAEAGRWAVAG